MACVASASAGRAGIPAQPAPTAWPRRGLPFRPSEASQSPPATYVPCICFRSSCCWRSRFFFFFLFQTCSISLGPEFSWSPFPSGALLCVSVAQTRTCPFLLPSPPSWSTGRLQERLVLSVGCRVHALLGAAASCDVAGLLRGFLVCPRRRVRAGTVGVRLGRTARVSSLQQWSEDTPGALSAVV